MPGYCEGTYSTGHLPSDSAWSVYVPSCIKYYCYCTERLLVSVTPTSQSVSLGVDATFSCNASATAVTYLWLKNDQPIVPNIKASSLVLRNVTYFDMATYSCVVMLGNQRVTASASLRINGNSILI